MPYFWRSESSSSLGCGKRLLMVDCGFSYPPPPPPPPKWWFPYVDDSHACLRKDQVDQFHKHFNSINPDIQFTLELENTNEQGLPFVDTVTRRRGRAIHVDVYRKPRHTDRYIDFFSCHPLCHKRSVVNTLLKRANNILSTNKGRREETQRVKAVLRDNN